LIACFQVLEHVNHPQIAMEKLFHMLKPNGILILSYPFIGPVHGEPHDTNRITKDGLKILAKDTGFNIKDLRVKGNSLTSIGYMLEMSSEDFTDEELNNIDQHQYMATYSIMQKESIDMLYDNYIDHQLSKHTGQHVKLWTGKEWNKKMADFTNTFNFHKRAIFSSGYRPNCLSVGSRTGQEVVALEYMGARAIGIDLFYFPPHVKKGDMHNIAYDNNTFDFTFTNVLDHAKYIQKAVNELIRVTKSDGYILIHFVDGYNTDKYSANQMHDKTELKTYIGLPVVSERVLNPTLNACNYEILIHKP
jgi:SAM-dependent methyltransferase